MPDKRKSKMVEFSSETVIFDEKGNRVIACPTEQEAVEYVREQEQEADREGCEYHECNKPGRKPRSDRRQSAPRNFRFSEHFSLCL